MAKKPIPAVPADPMQLSHAEFRWFILHFPQYVLTECKIKRTSFTAVGMTLAMFGNYATGTNVSVTLHGIRRACGAHHDTIVAVIDVLKLYGALEVTGHSQSPNGGKPSEEYRFRRSQAVRQALEARDNRAFDPASNDAGEPGSTAGEPGSTAGEPGSTAGEHNRTSSTSSTSSDRSLANALSPAPDDALLPVGTSVGAAEISDGPKEAHSLDHALSHVGSLPSSANRDGRSPVDELEDLLGGLAIPDAR